ncbi:MAG: hypothetical protein M1825_002602 [Sarcosagium campestre]|nr:MAG: hypothetical protein M1825_002602 [Sarcosagium campestre]
MKGLKLTDFFRPRAQPDKRQQGKENLKRNDIEDCIIVAQTSVQSPGHDVNAQVSEPKPTQSSDEVPDRSSGSVPLSNSSNQRIVKDGKVIIRSSDDEDSDSDLSLMDLDQLLAIPRPANAKTESLIPNRAKDDRLIALENQNKRGLKRQRTRHYKFSLASLVDHAEKEIASEADVKRAKIALKVNDDEAGEGGNDTEAESSNNIDRSAVVSMVQEGQEQGNAQKMMNAVSRTEVLRRPKIWHFFDRDAAKRSSIHSPFPDRQLSRIGWTRKLEDPFLRQQTFTSGFAEEMISRGSHLPDEICQWLLDEILIGSRQKLVHAYIHALAASPSQIEAVLSPEKISEIFLALGASKEALDLSTPLRPVFDDSSGVAELDNRQLLNIIQLLRTNAPHLSPKSKQHCICFLMRMTLDAAVSSDAEAIMAIEDAQASLLDSIDAEAWDDALHQIGDLTFRSITHAPLRLQLLRSLPVQSARLHTLRRRLAASFFFDRPAYITQAATSPLIQIPRLTRYLQQQPSFKVGPDTDYAELGALMSMLDMALDDGVAMSDLDSRQDEAAFNADIDALAAQVKAMSNQIVDTGASHMTRTEAKEVLTRFLYRLVYAVSTRERRRRDIFHADAGPDGVESGVGGAGSIVKFLSRSKAE